MSYKERIKLLIYEELLRKTRTGELHSTDDGKIVKITNDRIEYENAQKLIKNSSPVFIKYHSAKPIGNEKYELLMDKIYPLNDKEWDLIDLIQNSLGSQDYMLDDKKRNSFIKELKMNPEYYEDYASLNEVLSMLKVLQTMYVEASRRGIILYDLRAQNIGKTLNGNYVHFDVGSG